MELYVYKAHFLSTVDGDTVDILLDLGFRIQWQLRIRMFGINAPEKKLATMEAGRASQKFLEDLLRTCTTLELKSYKDEADKYGGRWLGELYSNVKYDPQSKVAHYDATAPLVNLNQLMVTAGYAVPYNP